MPTPALAKAKQGQLSSDVTRLRDFIDQHQNLFILTGAGCSTASGIPDYRDKTGKWKGATPIQHQDFIKQLASRKRYWSRSMMGWAMVWKKHPNAAHYAIAQLQKRRPQTTLITQNVDGLHRDAGSPSLIELHGRLDQVTCLACKTCYSRDYMQRLLEAENPDWRPQNYTIRPDGDAHLGDIDYSSFQVPACPRCGGVVMPDVVFFGGSVPKDRVAQAYEGLEQANAVLVVGSSLMVWSGFRFIRDAAKMGLPIAAINQGMTRADELINLKLNANCVELLSQAIPTL